MAGARLSPYGGSVTTASTELSGIVRSTSKQSPWITWLSMHTPPLPNDLQILCPIPRALKMRGLEFNHHVQRLGISGDVHAVIPLGPMAFPADLHGDHAEDGLLRSHLDTQDGAPYLGRA